MSITMSNVLILLTSGIFEYDQLTVAIPEGQDGLHDDIIEHPKEDIGMQDIDVSYSIAIPILQSHHNHII